MARAVRRYTGSPFATSEIIETMAEEAYAANPYAIPYESPRYRPAADLEAMSRAGWEWVRAHHTREQFSRGYRQSMLEILERFRPALARKASERGA